VGQIKPPKWAKCTCQTHHRLCDDQQTKSHVKQLRDEYMRDHVNIGVENAGPMGVVEFWDKVYLPFIESTNNLKPSGPLTAPAFELIIGKADRFQCGKQIASYLGLVPLEDSSGNRRRLGHITKQGNSLLRFLLVEAAQVTARSLPEWRSQYVHLTMSNHDRRCDRRDAWVGLSSGPEY
jgi:hypothetical protein